jgi:glutamine synthetase
MEEAFNRFENSEMMREFFGQAFCEALLAHNRYELDYFRTNVSDLERSRYLEYV